jgi:tetratricopeptide (TPR) repeat protein
LSEKTAKIRWRRQWLLVLLALVAAYLLVFPWSVDVDRLLIDARKALLQRQHALAAELANRILSDQPSHPDALMIAAVAAAEQGSYADAAKYCSQVTIDAHGTYFDARLMAGNLHLNQLQNLSSAEESFRLAFAANADSPAACSQLAQVLSLQTRTWEFVPFQLRLIRQDVVSPSHILSLMQSDLLFADPDLIREFRGVEPNHAGLILAESRQAILRQDYRAAKSLVILALKANPQLDEAHARLGRILLIDGTTGELQRWRKNLPASAMDHPDTWIALGHLAERLENGTGAARCFWEAGRRDAASLSANYRLGKQLASLGRPDEADLLLKRARGLEKYRKLFDQGGTSDSPISFTPELLQQSQRLAESIGLLWEAYAFARLATQMQPAPQWAEEAATRLRGRCSGLPLARTAPQLDLFRSIDISEYSLPVDVVQVADAAVPAQTSTHLVHFEEVAERLGITFRFDNGVDKSISGAQRPYDFTGGGIAAFDADGDSWPDLYFSQGCVLDDQTGRSLRGQSDQLYRNHRGSRFVDAGAVALPQGLDYSQGVAAGDINNDGFPDLFVGNLGPNRLLQNNGDGTFSDLTVLVEDDFAQWTTSCVICDLNGDQWPDLYSVNYLSGDILSRVCRDHTGRKNSCAPQSFSAAQDQIHLGDGGGLFINVTDSSGIRIPNGKGLGTVVADLNDDQKLDLLIANDGVPNFLFVNTTEAKQIGLQEVAMERGVAVNGDGLSEACMGVVVEDLNGDMHPDLFVTNFLDETNTLYNGSGLSGFFRDEKWTSGLSAASLPVLGFGVQALDGDLDGLPDLIVANGHVDDFTDRKVPYQMSPQYFRNVDGLHFTEQDPKSVGSWFAGKYLGRCVARLDWDRDMAEEVVIGMLDQNASLLHNTTSSPGSGIALKLHSMKSQRDAIGAVVSVTTDLRTIRRQLVAGDGYMASNHRMLIFGLGASPKTAHIAVTWPNGEQQVFPETNVDQEYIAIEGRRFLYPVPK